MALEIRQFQENLLYFGFALPEHGADGKWGGETQAAMNAFQQAFGIPPTQKPNQRTIEVMNLQTDKPYTISLQTLLNAIRGEEAPAPGDGGLPPPIPDVYSTVQPKKGLPWWGWALIGLGAVGVVGGGIYLYYRYARKPAARFEELGEGDLGCSACMAGAEEPDGPHFRWGKYR